ASVPAEESHSKGVNCANQQFWTCRAKCKDYQLEMQGLVARVKSHREKCQQKQEEVAATEEELDDPGTTATLLASTSTEVSTPLRRIWPATASAAQFGLVK
ncbi:unnamed protein product, partial [Lepeophtheirus salmonis]